MSWTPDQMAARAVAELAPGMVVNLGIGLPTRIAGLLPENADVWLQTENGLLGMGPPPWEGEEDPQLINAGKETVTVRRGGSFFDSAMSFAMIRGGHVDLAILGALQVSATGDLANWAIPGGRTLGVGGAMDLAAGAGRVVVMMRHCTKLGEPKLVSELRFPLTARGVVHRVITELGIFDVQQGHFACVQTAEGVSWGALQDATGAPLEDRRAQAPPSGDPTR